jgi:hypothetical protein
MAGRVKLYTVDHHHPPLSPDGGIVSNFPVSAGDSLLGNSTFADMLAQYWQWRHGDLEPYIIGFQGYRKHLDFRLGREVKGPWVSVTPIEFRQYQLWQQDCAGPNIEYMLKDHDILVAPAFDVSYNVNIAEDFKRSASVADWNELERTMKRYGEFDFAFTGVPGYCNLTTTGAIFNQWMKLWWKVVCDLTLALPETCGDPGPNPPVYMARRMAYLSERLFAIWLHSSGLRVKYLPHLICRELQ